MSADWPLRKISEVAEFLNSKRVPLKSLDRDKRQGEFPYYGASGIVDYIDDYIFDGTYLLISEDGENLRSRKTPIAFKASGRFWVNNHAHILAEKEEGILDYLEYYFSKLDLTPYITGAVQPKLNKANLDTIEIPIPPLEERLYINRVLNSFTDKIELNRQTNQTLEHIAQAIFKSWFVDFEPTRAKVQIRASVAQGRMPGSDGSFGAEGSLPAGFTQEDEDLLVERAAMAAISGKSLEALESLQQTNPEQYEQLKTTAALFPDALVDSELGEIPEGWEVACIDDVCDFQNGYAFKSKEMSKSSVDTYKVFKMGHIKKGGGLNQAGTKDYYDKDKCEKLGRYIIKKGDLLMCMTDMKNNVALLGHTALMDVDDEYILNQRVGLLRTKNVKKANYPYLYILTNSEAFIEGLRSRANSGVQVNLSTKEIKDTKFILPSEKVHIAFDGVVERAQETVFSLESEQEYLADLRDSLLPKLLSGALLVTK